MGRAVPYATDAAGQVVSPQEAAPGGAYACLECREPVSFRRTHTRLGREVAAHFAHRSGSRCAGESVVHLAAKFRLREALEKKARPFRVQRACSRWHCPETWEETITLPDYDVAAEEVPLGTYRLDVATLLRGQVVMGFEVFHSHRIGEVKSAGLPVPWVELQAGPTADDPYVFRPVVDERLTGDGAWSLRYSFAERQEDLPEALDAWISRAPALDHTPRGMKVRPDEVERIFSARRQQSTLSGDGLCPRCEQAWLAFVARQQEQRDLERKAESLEFERQRTIFGPGLKRAFNRHDVQDMTHKASTLRYALRYLPRPKQLIAHFRQHPYERLIARRCTKCQKPMLWVDSQEYLVNPRVYFPMIEFFKPDPERRGFFIPK